MRRARYRHPGYTAVELLAVLAIVAILAALAAPSFRDLIRNLKLSSTANDLFAAVSLTRSEAIKRGSRVDLVPADGADWANGWVIYVDQNHNRKRDGGETIVFSHGPAPAGMTIVSRFTDSEPKYLAYNGTGRTCTNASPQQPQIGHFLLALDDKKRKIILNLLGRPKACNPELDKTAC